MNQTENISLNSSNVDIVCESDLESLKEKRPKKKYGAMHVSFICMDCKCIKTLMLRSIRSFPILCRGCQVKHRYDDRAYIEKMKQTNLAKYGVEYNSQTLKWKESIKKTSLEKYGVEHFSCAPEIRKKIRETTLTRYGAIGFGSDELRDKQRQTMIDKYNGYHNMVIPELKEQFFANLVNKYGGIGNAVSTIHDKQKKTMRTLYGVDSITQNGFFTEKCKKKYLYNNIYFDSLPEIQYYMELVASRSDFEYHPHIRFTYDYNGKYHYYFPDFKVNGQLIELKGHHFFNKSVDYIDYNDDSIHMINPYNRKYDGIADAKFQCMKQNNVKIIIVYHIKNAQSFIKNNHIIAKQRHYNSKK